MSSSVSSTPIARPRTEECKVPAPLKNKLDQRITSSVSSVVIPKLAESNTSLVLSAAERKVAAFKQISFQVLKETLVKALFVGDQLATPTVLAKPGSPLYGKKYTEYVLYLDGPSAPVDTSVKSIFHLRLDLMLSKYALPNLEEELTKLSAQKRMIFNFLLDGVINNPIMGKLPFYDLECLSEPKDSKIVRSIVLRSLNSTFPVLTKVEGTLNPNLWT